MTESEKSSQKLDRGSLEDHRAVIKRLVDCIWLNYDDPQAVADALYLLEYKGYEASRVLP